MRIISIISLLSIRFLKIVIYYILVSPYLFLRFFVKNPLQVDQLKIFDKLMLIIIGEIWLFGKQKIDLRNLYENQRVSLSKNFSYKNLLIFMPGQWYTLSPLESSLTILISPKKIGYRYLFFLFPYVLYILLFDESREKIKANHGISSCLALSIIFKKYTKISNYYYYKAIKILRLNSNLFFYNEGSTNFDFDGRLSFSWPNTPTQFSLNRFDNDYEPLFAYGFGLTYSDQDTLGDDLDESGSSTGGEIVINSIPGLVQAEDYSDMFGIQIENTTDNGGGSNVGYIESGDWIEYLIDVGDSGDYFVEYRLASLNGSTGFEVLVDNEKLDTQTVPSTGGWQNWVTESSTLTLDAGQQVLRINALGPSWNINWLRFTRI